MKRSGKKTKKLSRRDFIKTSATAAVSLAALTAGSRHVYAAGSDKLRVGLIGCGGRGTEAALNCVESSENVDITAIADLFKDRMDESRKTLAEKMPNNCKVTDDTCFVGFDAYEKVIAADVDIVILATPPHFRPMHLKAAVEADKHVFMEKPVAVDPLGVRSVIASSKIATEKKLAIVAGTQRRHDLPYLEIMKRIHNGEIGKIVSGQCYWNDGIMMDYWKYYQPEGLSGMEWQLRSWPWFTWLSGDHIVEQHVHNLDVMNWAIGAHPVKAIGMGGRQLRKIGNIFDHFAVEYEYPEGVRIISMCRQMDGCTNRISERIVGTKGDAYGDGTIKGANPYKYEGPDSNPFIQEHTDLIESIRRGEPINEGQQIAESTMTAIMGRMSAYTGRELSWNWVMNTSKLDLSPPKYEMGDLPVQPVAVPGETKLL